MRVGCPDVLTLSGRRGVRGADPGAHQVPPLREGGGDIHQRAVHEVLLLWGDCEPQEPAILPRLVQVRRSMQGRDRGPAHSVVHKRCALAPEAQALHIPELGSQHDSQTALPHIPQVRTAGPPQLLHKPTIDMSSLLRPPAGNKSIERGTVIRGACRPRRRRTSQQPGRL